MIDIIKQGPFLNIQDLLSGTMQETGAYFLHFFIVWLLFFLLKKVPAKRLSAFLMFVLTAICLYTVYGTGLKSEFIFSLCLALTASGQIWLLQMLPLHLSDYLFLFSALLFPARLFNTTSAMFGNLWLFWIIFCAVYAAVKLHYGRVRKNHFACYFYFILLSLSCYSYYLSCLFLPSAFTADGRSSGISLAITAAAAMVFFLLTAFLTRKFFREKLLQLNQLGASYPKIERYYLWISLIILFLFTCITVPFSVLQLHNILIMLLIPCLCLALLVTQLPFIILLYRAAFYKDSATFSAWEKENLVTYYQDLSESINAMQSIRHDMKNIFFTMGNYVDRSDDSEMKDFFWQKIYPYSLKTIRQNELLSRLYQIPVEALRAFLNLKISQAVNQGIGVELKINIVPEAFQTGMDIIDLTRILGILFDNAIEETMQLQDGTIEIKISGNAEGCSYIIKNPVTAQTLENGIRAGRTSKGGRHGKGLEIVRRLLAQYHNAVLNTSLCRSACIQSLNLLFEPVQRATHDS